MKQNVVNIANELSQAGVNSQYGVIKLIGLELPLHCTIPYDRASPSGLIGICTTINHSLLTTEQLPRCWLLTPRPLLSSWLNDYHIEKHK